MRKTVSFASTSDWLDSDSKGSKRCPGRARARSARLLLLGAGVVSALLACSGSEAPLELVELSPTTRSSLSDDCDAQIIPDESCNTPTSGGGLPYDVTFDSLLVSTSLEASTFESLTEYAPCPRTMSGHTTGIVRDPNTGFRYEFSSGGTWTIQWVSSLPYLGSGQAIYSWPQNFENMGWRAFNLDRPAAGPAEVWVGRARAACLAPGQVAFIVFYDVRVRDDNLRQTSYDGGGGSSAGTNCTFVWLDLEINYNDGTGWHPLWSGYVRVCG